MIIAVSGGTGFVGSHLIQDLVRRKHIVLQLTRVDFSPEYPDRLYSRLAEADAVIHLAGAPIMQRWNKKNKAEILNSRIDTTTQIVQALQKRTEKPCIFICMSAVGIYPMNGGVYDERYQGVARGFLAEVCQKWEAAAKLSAPHRCVILRSGLVMHADGGILKALLPLFKVVGVQVGRGKQPFSWIALEDLIRIINVALWDKGMSGAYNCVAPEACNNEIFSKALTNLLGKPYPILIPKWVFYVFLGKSASLLCKGSYIVPNRLMSIGFEFNFKTIYHALHKQVMSHPVQES